VGIDVEGKVRLRSRRLHGEVQRGKDKLNEIVGGRARRKAIVLLAAVLALSGADVGAISALAPQLESAFRVGNAGIGLLVTVSTLVGAIATMPVGVLADRLSRTRILSLSILLWGATELVSAFSVSFAMLLLTRLALGAVTATAGPTVASLTGDLFPAQERGRIYGMILTGELLGAGIGVLVAGDLGAAISWRVGLAILALPSLLLSWVIHRHFPEPARGGQSQLLVTMEEIPSAEAVAADPESFPNPAGAEVRPDGASEPGGAAGSAEDDPVLAAVEEGEVEPDESLVIAPDSKLTIWQAVRWVFSVPTNVKLIVSSALGYFFLSGLRTFALIYARGRFGIGQGMATILFLMIGAAAVAGVLVSGRWTDRLIRRGRVDARLLVGGWAFLVGVAAFIPGLLTGSALIGLPLFLVAAFALSAPNPPVDAARLDVVPSHMWGRAESIRTTVRTVLEALAPLIFGLLSAVLVGGTSTGFGSGVNEKSAHVSSAGTTGLEYTFLFMLVTLVGAGVLLLRARRTYLTDVATAAASERPASAAVTTPPTASRQPAHRAR
jgi:MFS family permease